MAHVRTATVFAVAVGIDNYSNSTEYTDLQGAAHDADAVEAVLKSRFMASTHQMRNLRNQGASQDEIISALRWLQCKRSTAGRTNKIFYFAGHGISAGGCDEILCPSDIGTRDAASRIRRGISASEILNLLHSTSNDPSTTVTVILDCCKSGKLLRGTTTNHTMKLSGGSYILLVGCGRADKALEGSRNSGGHFTQRLLDVIDSDEFDELTFSSAMHRLAMPPNLKQTPHFEGTGRHARISDCSKPGTDTSLVITRLEREGAMVIQAGSAEGITPQTRFTAHRTNLVDSKASPNPILSRLEVASVSTFSSTLVSVSGEDEPRLSSLFYSKRESYLSARPILLYTKDRAWLCSVIGSQAMRMVSVELVDDARLCELELSVVDGRVYFNIHSELITEWIGTRMHQTVDAGDEEAIARVLQSAQAFYFHLTRSAPTQFDDVRMELTELSPHTESPSAASFAENMSGKTGLRVVVVNEERQMGITVCNDGGRALYPYLLYFNPNDFSIVDYYMPPEGAGKRGSTIHVDAPLMPKSCLTIGYGDAWARPLQFEISNGAMRDVGFFRLFLSTRPASFESILQGSPFDNEGSARGIRVYPTPEAWAVQTVTVAIVQRC